MTTSNKAVSVYVHFPFCVKKCAYCAFFSKPCRDEKLFDDYTNALIKRIKSMPRLDVNTVYFGGGTPSVLGSERLCRTLDVITRSLNMRTDAEITVEVNPGTIDAEGLKRLKNGGFNRLSIGMQSANDKTLSVLGRIHSNADFLRCYEHACGYFDNVSVDLIFALPEDDFDNTVNQIINLSPSHVSAYSLILEEGTPLYNKRNDFHLPSEDEEERQYESLCNALSFAGYTHYEVSSFAKEGRESKHNTVYWERGDYIGIGPSAHSYYNGKRFTVPADTGRFIKNASLPFLSDTDYDTAPVISETESEEERIMLGLRLAKGVMLTESKLKTAKRFADMGFGKIENGVFSLNDKGFRVSNSIIAALI